MASNDLIVRNVMQSHLSSYFSNLPSLNIARSELKCKTVMKEPAYQWNLSNKDSWCLVPFSSNVSYVRPQNFSVLATMKNRSAIYQSTVISVDVVTMNCFELLDVTWKGMKGFLLPNNKLTRFQSLQAGRETTFLNR